MQGFTKKNLKDVQIAVDIGNYSIKAMAVSHAKAQPVLLNFSIKPIGDNIIKAITQAHAELGFTKIKVVASLSGPTVIARYIDIPSMNNEELAGAIRFEAEKVIPYDISEVQLDFAKIEDLDNNRIRVLIVAAKKDLVDSQMKILSEAGLEPVILDVDSFALANAFIHTGIDNTNVCGLLNIGFNKSNLNIVKDGKTYLSRDIDIGGRSIAKLIAENLSIPEKEALKIMEDKLARFEQLSEDERKPIEAPVADILSRLTDEAALSFDFYENQHESNVAKVFISGGISMFKTIEAFLKEALSRDLQKWNPVTGIEVSENLDSKKIVESSPQLAVVTGLALRKTE